MIPTITIKIPSPKNPFCLSAGSLLKHRLKTLIISLIWAFESPSIILRAAVPCTSTTFMAFLKSLPEHLGQNSCLSMHFLQKNVPHFLHWYVSLVIWSQKGHIGIVFSFPGTFPSRFVCHGKTGPSWQIKVCVTGMAGHFFLIVVVSSLDESGEWYRGNLHQFVFERRSCWWRSRIVGILHRH